MGGYVHAYKTEYVGSRYVRLTSETPKIDMVLGLHSLTMLGLIGAGVAIAPAGNGLVWALIHRPRYFNID